MFSFIHTADIHLDSPLHGLSQHADAPTELLRGATRRALENVVSLALEKAIDFVLIAGDLYDGDWPDYNTGLFFNKQMLRLNASNIPVYMISGNHDAASRITKSLQPPANVHVLSTAYPETIIVDDLPVAIHGQGFANQSVPENLALEYPSATADHFNIGMLHTSLTGNPEHDDYAPCSISDLTSKDYDYWALGHIHQHSIVHDSPHIIYCGNPQGRHIKETGERGCYHIEVGSDLSINKVNFVNTDIVRWEAIEIDITSINTSEELRDTLVHHTDAALDTTNGRLLALRITLNGDSAIHDQLHAELAHWQAECVNIAAEIDEELIWFERLRIKTKPTYDPHELAERSELTAQVLEALENFNPEHTPAPVALLTGKLKDISDKELQQVLSPTEDAQLIEDVRALVLQSISTSVND